MYRRFSFIRLGLVIVVVLVGFIAIIIRHRVLVTDHQDFLLKESQARTERQLTFFAKKGDIFDRHGHPLAVSTPYYRLSINPSKYPLDKKKQHVLAQALGMEIATLEEKLNAAVSKNYVQLASRLTKEQVCAVSLLKWDGLVFEEGKGRYYPLGESAAPVIGVVDTDGLGVMGIEYQFNRYMAAKDGVMDYTQNLLNQVTKIHQYVPAKPGQHLHLTLDARLQHQAYQILKQAAMYHNAEHVSCVILKAKSGEILAMANYPSFDPNQRLSSVGEATKNHVLTDLFEPGSIIKPLALAAMMPRIDIPEEIDTEGGSYMYLNHTFHDHKDLGQIAFKDILLKSSNIAMVKLYQQMKTGELTKHYQKFGLFSPTYSQFPGETIGRHVEKPTRVDEAAMTYGYGLSVNLLSMAGAYNIIANQGLDYGLHLVFEKHRPSPEQVLSQDIAQKIVEMMERVTQYGVSSYRAKVGGLTVAGKSGTTHLVGKNGEYVDEYVSTFAGFAPSQDPEVVVAVKVYKPTKHGHYGGQVAAPIFSKLVQAALGYREG